MIIHKVKRWNICWKNLDLKVFFSLINWLVCESIIAILEVLLVINCSVYFFNLNLRSDCDIALYTSIIWIRNLLMIITLSASNQRTTPFLTSLPHNYLNLLTHLNTHPLTKYHWAAKLSLSVNIYLFLFPKDLKQWKTSKSILHILIFTIYLIKSPA